MAHKGLNLDVVVKAAAELIEQQGRDAFSMRLLAEQLGIKTASLYNHVDNMEMLLAEVCRYGLCLQNEMGNKGDYADALKYFGLFVDVVNEPMFADDDELKADTLNALYACYATLAANMLKDNQAVIKYGNIGKNHKEEGYRALMCLAETYGQKEGGDSAKWLEVIKEGTELFPKQEYFVGNIMDYYIQKGMVDEGLAQINKLLATSETPYYLYVKGILLYEKKQYDDAVAIFNKIISNNGDLVAEAYSKIGDCYFFPAQIIVEENAKLAIDDPKYNENENKIKELYEKAKPYYEKAKELKPDNKALWGNYLLNIYWKLNRAEYDSLEKELGY